jgi:hypothetical protein
MAIVIDKAAVLDAVASASRYNRSHYPTKEELDAQVEELQKILEEGVR